MCNCTCRGSGRKPSVLLGLTRPSSSPSHPQHSSVLMRTTKPGGTRAVTEEHINMLIILMINILSQVNSCTSKEPLFLQAGRTAMILHCTKQEPALLQSWSWSGSHWIQMEFIQSRVSPCQGVILPETDLRLALWAIPLVLNAQTSLFVTVFIPHKGFLLHKELHLTWVNPYNDLKHTL